MKSISLDWDNKRAYYIDYSVLYDKMSQVNNIFSEIDNKMCDTDLGGINYESISGNISQSQADYNAIKDFTQTLTDYINSKLDSPFSKGLNLGATHTISNIHLEDYNTHNVGNLSHYTYDHDGYHEDQDNYAFQLTFKDFLGITGNEAENEEFYTGGEVTLNDNYVRSFANLYKEQYENSVTDGVTLEEYLNALYTSGEFVHKRNQPIKEFISGVLDALPVVGTVKSLIELGTGTDLVTGDDLTLSELQGMTFRVLFDLVTAEFSLGKIGANFNDYSDSIEVLIQQGNIGLNELKGLGISGVDDLAQLGVTSVNDLCKLGVEGADDLIKLGITCADDLEKMGVDSTNALLRLGISNSTELEKLGITGSELLAKFGITTEEDYDLFGIPFKSSSYSDFADGMSAADRARYIQNNETKFFEEFSDRASASGLNDVQISEAYDAMKAGDYEKMASYFDTSSPIDGAVFWSGNKKGAAAYADGIGGTIMEQTPGGQVFDEWRGLQGMYPEWNTGTVLDQKPIWKALSSQYASGVKGNVIYAHPTGYYGDVWLNTEYPILEKLVDKGIVTDVSEVITYGK